jgi:hypothetical protein
VDSVIPVLFHRTGGMMPGRLEKIHASVYDYIVPCHRKRGSRFSSSLSSSPANRRAPYKTWLRNIKRELAEAERVGAPSVTTPDWALKELPIEYEQTLRRVVVFDAESIADSTVSTALDRTVRAWLI